MRDKDQNICNNGTFKTVFIPAKQYFIHQVYCALETASRPVLYLISKIRELFSVPMSPFRSFTTTYVDTFMYIYTNFCLANKFV